MKFQTSWKVKNWCKESIALKKARVSLPNVFVKETKIALNNWEIGEIEDLKISILLYFTCQP